MNVARNHGQINIAKPIMMLAIMSGIEDGSVIANRILYSDSLIATYNALYKKYSKTPVTPSIYPYYYLGSEDFYFIKGKKARTTPSEKFIRENIEYTCFDDGLWELLQIPDVRNEIRAAIIQHFIEARK